MGHALFVTLEDIMSRYHRMKGRPTLWLPGTDHAWTAGQDLNLSTERLSANKALTNKLWNAGKFILQNLPRQENVSDWETMLDYKFDTEESLLKLPLLECWVVSKLHILIDVVMESYDKFFCGDVGREIYDFLWSDFADWYIEASKACLYHSGDKTVALVAQAVLLYVFENILKLLHQFMPFVTVALWQALPKRTTALIVSSQPHTYLLRHANSIKRFENLQALVSSRCCLLLNNSQAEYSVEPAKHISASIVGSKEVIQYISKEKDVMALLSRLDPLNIHFTDSPPGDTTQSVNLVATHLNSPRFIEKALEDIVCGVQEKAAEAEEKINLTKNHLAFLKSTVLVSK
ncbi:hypothetical protein SLA2020_305940 [Shorea laevis]